MNRKIFFQNAFFPYRIFTALSISFLAGVFTATFLHLSCFSAILIFIILWFLLFSLLFFVYNLRFFVLGCFCLIFLLLGIGYVSNFKITNSAHLDYSKEAQLSGKVVSNPVREADRQQLYLHANINSRKIKLIVNAPIYPVVYYGDTIEVTGKIANPEETTLKNYYRYHLVYGIVSHPQNFEITARASNNYDRIAKNCFLFTEKFENALSRIIEEPHSSLAAGLILGAKRNIPDNLMNDLKATGLTHIIALSGFNVSVIVMVFYALLLSYIGRKQAFFYSGGLIILFVFLTGASSSIVRAAIFSFLVLFCRLVGRRADSTNVLVLTAVAMILVNPLILVYDIGFQLSFLAFAGLIYISPLIQRFFEKSRLSKLPNFIKIALPETLGAQLGVLPIMLFSFGQISLIAPLSNLLVLWTIPLAMLLSFIAGLLGLIYTPLGQFGGLVLWPVLEYIIKVVELLARVPLASIQF